MRFPAFLLALVIALPAAAQTGLSDPATETPQPVVTRPIAPVMAGERQSSDQIAQEAGITPMARVNARIQNRVQSRINNRLERTDRPSASAMATFVAPGEQVRRAGQAARR